MIDIDTQKTKDILLKMLREIDDICKKYNITYYAAGGTTLGAVRHKGFIPWDDDADIYMTRDEFNKFRQAFHKEKPSARHLSCLEENPNYPAVIPRYIDDNTTFITRSAVLESFPAGYVIDIFILDPIPDDKDKINEYINLMYVYNDFIMPFYVFSTRCSDDYLHLYFEYKKKEKKEGRQSVLAELENKLFSYKEEECSKYALRWGSCPQIFDKDMMGKPVYFPFEDMQIPLPERYYDYLVQLYGVDWMNMPESIEEQGHVAIINPDRPYADYFAHIKSMVDQNHIYDNLIDRKGYVISTEIKRRPYRNVVLQKHIKYVKTILLEKQKEYNVNQLLEEGRFDILEGIFDDLISLQFSNMCIGKLNHAFMLRYHEPVLIELESDRYIGVVKTIFHTKGIDLAKKYISVLNNNDIEIDEIETFKTYIYQVEKLIQAYNLKDYIRVESILKTLSEDNIGSSIYIERIRCLMEVQKNGENKNSNLLEKLEKKYAENNKDIYIRKAIADYYYNTGTKDLALQIYEKVAKTSYNVFVLNDISEKIERDALCIEKAPKESPRSPLTKTGETYYELLIEIDKMCRSNGIEYTLAGKTLWAAKNYQVFDNEEFPPKIAMTPQNAEKFISIIEKEMPRNRTIKYLGNSIEHSKYSVHYYNTETAFLDLFFPQRTEGLYIDISILRQRDRRRINRTIERVNEIVNYQIYDDIKAKGDRLNSILLGMNIVKKLFGGKEFRKKHFEHYIKNIQNGDGKYYEVGKGRLRKALYYLPGRIFKSYSDAKVYDYEFMTVMDTGGYFRNWKTEEKMEDLNLSKRKLLPRYIANTSMSAESLKKLLNFGEEDRIKWEEYSDAGVLRRGGMERRRPFQRAYDLLNLTHTRFKLAEAYSNTKDSVVKAYEIRDYSCLEELLKEYDLLARVYVKKRLGLCFDNEILNIYIDLLNEKGEKKLARKIKRFVPKEHLNIMINELI